MISFEDVLKSRVRTGLLPVPKIKIIYDELLTIPFEGDLAEIGVFGGATSLLMRLMYPDRILHCYDTFCGIKGSDPSIDKHKDGDFSCSLEKVQKVVGTENTFYHVGFFPESFNEGDKKFAFVHSDTDTYVGTKSSIQVMYPLLVQGGIMVFDDYGWSYCPGVKKAIDEWGMSLNARVYESHQWAITKEKT